MPRLQANEARVSSSVVALLMSLTSQVLEASEDGGEPVMHVRAEVIRRAKGAGILPIIIR